MPLDEYCLPSSNILSNHCPDVLIYSIQIDSEYHERKEDSRYQTHELFYRIDHN